MLKKGFKHSEETKLKIKERTILAMQDKDLRKRLSDAKIGTKVSDTTKQKMSHTHKTKVDKSYLVGRFGEKSNAYIQDRSLLRGQIDRRNDTLYKYWRICVYRRDEYRCRINDQNCLGRIEAHHILTWGDYPELRYEVNNGITLCKYHHPRKKEDVIKSVCFFNSIIKNNVTSD